MYRKFLKRFFDIFFCLISLPFIFVLILIIAPLIFLGDKGSIFYVAPRLGKQGRVFNIIKFRTMNMNAPDIRNKDGSTFNSKTDPRVTRVGRFLRKTSLDELPQIINVLKGDMSLIGPRPNMATTSYDKLNDIRRKRLTLRPGITGYNQAYFRNSISSEEKYLNDVYYVDNVSFLFDVKIFIKTIFSVIYSKNIYK